MPIVAVACQPAQICRERSGEPGELFIFPTDLVAQPLRERPAKQVR
ncbi:Uncharacterised protein [Mycobacteroides abscessus subsp. abscessus]|nr:Uncharacterised protein [Mycobacteroides abscessus subsp. abscessus]